MNDKDEKKLRIVSIDSPEIQVYAQFNPKELSVDKSVPWSKFGNTKSDSPELEFTNGENRTISLELFFDKFEEQTSVFQEVNDLHRMTQIREDASNDEDKHPPRVMLIWGPSLKFAGVIESLSTKYTMFLQDGTPVRATCSIKIKETSKAQGKKASES